MSELADRLDAIWRIEGAAVIATLTRMTGDVTLAEDFANDAVLAALRQWNETGVPKKPGAWLTAVAKRRAIDTWRNSERQGQYVRNLARKLDTRYEVEWQPVDDDVLKLVLIACHPVLSTESQVALTLRVVGGLSTTEIARLLLASVPAVQARITRAKRALGEAAIPFDVPDPHEWPERLTAVLGAVYLIFTEGYAATRGPELIRHDLAREGLRLGRVVAGLLPREPEVHALLALMEFQASRFAARVDAQGTPILLEDQDRSRWNRRQIRRGSAALAYADSLGRGRGPYGLQAAIAQHHAIADSVDSTDWHAIVVLYEALSRITMNPFVELNHAVAVSMASGAEVALPLVDKLAETKVLSNTHTLPSVRGELLARMGAYEQARREFVAASEYASNARVAEILRHKAENLGIDRPSTDRPSRRPSAGEHRVDHVDVVL